MSSEGHNNTILIQWNTLATAANGHHVIWSSKQHYSLMRSCSQISPLTKHLQNMHITGGVQWCASSTSFSAQMWFISELWMTDIPQPAGPEAWSVLLMFGILAVSKHNSDSYISKAFQSLVIFSACGIELTMVPCCAVGLWKTPLLMQGW